ncbi:MAG TPA: response regulator [Rhizobiaceae bacterium]|nr:response regulator [Rhizobiaceae bacterium]
MKSNVAETNEVLFASFLAALLAVVFVIDLMVPLGTAVWIIYLVPTVLSYMAWRQPTPLFVALAVTTLVAVAFAVDRSGITPSVALLNRSMGVATVWVLAGIGVYLIRNKRAVRRQEWLRSGEVGLARQMAGELTVERLGEQIVAFLCSNLGARAATMFVRDGDRFLRIAANGVPSDAPVPAEFRRNDGLLGQAVTENRNIRLDEVPDGYLYFGSSLGRSKPAKLLIAPTRQDGEVNGAIELGFTGPIPDDAMELLDRISPMIGTAIRSGQYRARLQELLEETRRQAEELRAHTEELATANEELEEQSQSLQESQKRLELQQAELEQTNAQLEEQAQLLETQRDDLARARDQLQGQTRQLESASRYKSEFVANMSHELRTPLNALLIMARLLADNRDNNLTEEQVSFARTIESSGNDLLALINDILDISKIEAGKLELQPEEVKIAELVEKLTGTFRSLGAEKDLTVRSEIAEDTPPTLETDPQRLEQILKNFLSNAVKFTDAGEVVLSVRPAADGRIGFSVRDTGIGIAEDEQHLIFEAFQQADGTISRKYGGTGLGLSISRDLAGLLGGTIELESRRGEGSTFSILLPRTFAAGAPSKKQPLGALGRGARSGSPARPAVPAPSTTDRIGVTVEDDRERITVGDRAILVVEDDKAFARILLDLAHEVGFKCIIASTAEDGVLAARQYLPHAVILDIGLPDHTGLTVLDRLKRDTRTRHIPVHVVSAEDHTQAAFAYGAAGYMLKPIKRDELAQALERLETRFATSMRRVLIVEDDPAQLQGLTQLLALKDVETVGSATAADCLERLRSETFDCMVLDMTLPDASGFDVLEKLAEDSSFSFPPVIVYTARELSEDEELRLRKYSKSIIIKGAKSPERLLDEVTLFLHQVVSELPADHQQMLATSLNRDALLEGRRILVVEDDVRNVYAITSVFEPHGAKVQIARNGREALRALDRIEEGAPPIDLVLMDVMMPEMDGLTATREIRLRETAKSLPIIMLTAKAMPDDQEQCLAAGANDYLSKPLDVDKLLSLTRVWMPR